MSIHDRVALGAQLAGWREIARSHDGYPIYQTEDEEAVCANLCLIRTAVLLMIACSQRDIHLVTPDDKYGIFETYNSRTGAYSAGGWPLPESYNAQAWSETVIECCVTALEQERG